MKTKLRTMIGITAVAVIMILAACPALARVIELDAKTRIYDLRTRVAVLEDQGWSIEQASSPALAGRFAAPGKDFYPGQSKSGFWMRFTVRHPGGIQKNSWFLRISPPQPRFLTLYQKNDQGGWSEWHAGDGNPQRSNLDDGIFLTTPLLPTSAPLSTYYIFYKTDDVFYTPMELTSLKGLMNLYGFRSAFLGTTLGFALALTLYNLFLYLFLKDKSYFYYMLYCVFITTYYMGLYDLLIELFGLSDKWALTFTFFPLYLFVAASAQFVRHFLLTKQSFPRLDLALRYFSAWGLVLACSSFWMTSEISSIVGGTTGLVMGGLYIYAGVVSYRNGFYSAKYYLLSWSLFMLASIAYSLVNLGVINFSMTALVLFQSGNLLEMLLLSVALANRITMLTKQRDMAELRAEARSAFLANMSHELITPISAIISMNHMVEIHNKDKNLEQFMKVSKESSEHLSAVVDDILNLSKIEAGALKLKNQDFDLAQLVDSAMAIIKVGADKKGLELRQDVEKDLPPVKGDPVRLKQVLINLLSNALKYTDTGYVRLKISREKSENGLKFLFSVKDTGRGISAADQQAIFTSFVRADDLADPREGAGLGLAISKQLVEKMGGEIWVKSARDQGSEFFFTVILSPGKPVPEKEETRPPVPAAVHGAGLRVLVAEDKKDMAFYMEQLFKVIGQEAHIAKNGEEVIAALKEQDFDLVLMDMRMPGMSGVQATKLIRQGKAGEKNKGIQIIGLSAYVLDEFKQQGFDAGMNGFLNKPVKMEKLLEVLDHLKSRHY